ncbi:YuiB family protein [Priestia taiwanensis]|uniref:Membrane protein YuiB n=1 Tax=Priestia taiwanensis TaxID=1347902 RepID=A0A917AXF0_9BACI|nr:YuiB family protein [Priestia taiwanensis]MBM7364598.1 hypothetical protein [Priestia taiwanensis]GGE80241.1 putative membrane protein YuiB [Priestia taiwanensis]
MTMSIPVVILSMVLFFVLFFGIGFLLNMLLRATWVMVIIYPIVALLFISTVELSNYFTNPSDSFVELKQTLVGLASADIIILAAGMGGAIVSGIVIRMLRNRGYQMF